MKKFILVTLLFALPSKASIDISSCLSAAYPSITVTQENIIFSNNHIMPLGSISNKPFTQILNSATIKDQLSQKYPLEFKQPKQYQDPGRIRNDEFFKNLYGSSLSEINQNIVSVYWKPSNSYVRFNRLHGAAENLERVGNEIAKYPHLVKYVNKTLGTLNFRKIAGTNRLSAHSFGIAIDFQLPKHLHKYWRWDNCKTEDQICPYPNALMNDNTLREIVKIFEAHGFIWGGKWASYDSVHFEYRPELLINACR